MGIRALKLAPIAWDGTYTTVSMTAKRFEKSFEKDKEISDMLMQIIQKLKAKRQ